VAAGAAAGYEESHDAPRIRDETLRRMPMANNVMIRELPP
jgi:hypothetical protein